MENHMSLSKMSKMIHLGSVWKYHLGLGLSLSFRIPCLPHKVGYFGNVKPHIMPPNSESNFSEHVA